MCAVTMADVYLMGATSAVQAPSEITVPGPQPLLSSLDASMVSVESETAIPIIRLENRELGSSPPPSVSDILCS